MAAMLSALLCGFDQRSIPVQKPDAVVGKQDKLPVGFHSRRGDYGLFSMVIPVRTNSPVIFGLWRLNEDGAEQAVMPVIPQIAKGGEQSGAIFSVCVPQILDFLPPVPPSAL